jgi:hypothetical protein
MELLATLSLGVSSLIFGEILLLQEQLSKNQAHQLYQAPHLPPLRLLMLGSGEGQKANEGQTSRLSNIHL